VNNYIENWRINNLENRITNVKLQFQLVHTFFLDKKYIRLKINKIFISYLSIKESLKNIQHYSGLYLSKKSGIGKNEVYLFNKNKINKIEDNLDIKSIQNNLLEKIKLLYYF
jgi:hypothetical protein